MNTIRKPVAAAVLAALCPSAWADDPAAPTQTLDAVTVTASRPAGLAARLPTTVESVTGNEVRERINAVDSGDALKYLPSLNVRKRYIGDYDHAVLASRASGTGNSARSLVYADGILLSNLLGNGAVYTPRWGLVTPEEIERVDVLYGPFAAAYPGNSVGAVVDYVTRMPKALEAHAKLSAFNQSFKLYGTDADYAGHQLSASLGNRRGNWAWRASFSRLDSEGQPLAFVTRAAGTAPARPEDTPVQGAVLAKDPKNNDWYVLGATSQAHTLQNQAKIRLAYDLSPSLRASYVFGWWSNRADRTSQTYLRDAQGRPVWSGNVALDGRRYSLSSADFAPSKAESEHVMHGLTVKSHTRGAWDWELAASLYDYAKDRTRSPATQRFNADGSRAAPVAGFADLGGTGWATLALKGIWRPAGREGAHLVDFGYQLDRFKLRSSSHQTQEWTSGAAAGRLSAFRGDTELQSLFAQDAWRFAPDWKATFGARLERWRAFDGRIANGAAEAAFAGRAETHVSPKLALSNRIAPGWVLKTSVGRAVRMPSVAELYQGSLSSDVIVNNDPDLRPEKSWTQELSAEHDLDAGWLRATLFQEHTRDALYSQSMLTAGGRTETRVANVGRIRTRGVELAWRQSDLPLAGLDLSGNLTYADSEIRRNDAFPASVGKRQPRVPRWRGNLLAAYRYGEAWTLTVGARYSGRQYNTLDNSDPNGMSYTGTSRYFVTDLRLSCRVAPGWSAALGVDNLNNRKYWAYHPYPQRTVLAELRFDH